MPANKNWEQSPFLVYMYCMSFDDFIDYAETEIIHISNVLAKVTFRPEI